MERNVTYLLIMDFHVYVESAWLGKECVIQLEFRFADYHLANIKPREINYLSDVQGPQIRFENLLIRTLARHRQADQSSKGRSLYHQQDCVKLLRLVLRKATGSAVFPLFPFALTSNSVGPACQNHLPLLQHHQKFLQETDTKSNCSTKLPKEHVKVGRGNGNRTQVSVVMTQKIKGILFYYLHYQIP